MCRILNGNRPKDNAPDPNQSNYSHGTKVAGVIIDNTPSNVLIKPYNYYYYFNGTTVTLATEIESAEKCTEVSCSYHLEVLRNLPDLILHSIAEQNFRMFLLTNKGVRDKLLTYFNALSIENNSKSFILPFSLTDLADYLMVDRSAMMRELKRMTDEKIIKKNKNEKSYNQPCLTTMAQSASKVPFFPYICSCTHKLY